MDNYEKFKPIMRSRSLAEIYLYQELKKKSNNFNINPKNITEIKKAIYHDSLYKHYKQLSLNQNINELKNKKHLDKVIDNMLISYTKKIINTNYKNYDKQLKLKKWIN